MRTFVKTTGVLIPLVAALSASSPAFGATWEIDFPIDHAKIDKTAPVSTTGMGVNGQIATIVL